MASVPSHSLVSATAGVAPPGELVVLVVEEGREEASERLMPGLFTISLARCKSSAVGSLQGAGRILRYGFDPALGLPPPESAAARLVTEEPAATRGAMLICFRIG